MKWFIKCIKNYVNFTGRARRREYWFFVLFSMIFMILAAILDMTLFGSPVGVGYTLFGLFLLLPSLAVMVRRLHDVGRSGKILLWYYLAVFVWMVALMITGFSFFVAIGNQANFIHPDDFLSLLPVSFIATYFVGMFVFLVWSIFFLVWFCTPGPQGDNKYGPDPKAVEE